MTVTVKPQLLIFHADPGICFDRAGDEHIAADNGIPANDRIPSENRRTGIDRYIISHRRMALDTT